MERMLLHQLVDERRTGRERDAAVERLVRRDRGRAPDAVVTGGGLVWAWRRAVGFRLVRLGLRTALGESRC
jgi:hypothetical protein